MNVSIFLSGAMGDLPYEEQIKWRNRVELAITNSEYELKNKPVFFSPPNYFSSSFPEDYKTEKEVMNFDLRHLKDADIIVVNLDNVANSIGTIFELATAYELRKPIIALNKNGEIFHPWIEECCDRQCKTLRELVDYICKYYLM